MDYQGKFPEALCASAEAVNHFTENLSLYDNSSQKCSHGSY